MTRPPSTSVPLAYSCLVIAALFVGGSPPAFAGIFGANKNDVAVKVATLPERYPDVPVWALDFSPDGEHLVAGSDNQNIHIWDWRNGRIENTIVKPGGSNNGVASNPIAYSPDGHLLAVCLGRGVGDAVIRVWNTESWSIENDITDHGPGGCEAMTFTPDGQSLIYAIGRVTQVLRPNEMIAYSVGTWDLAWSLQFPLGPESVAINPTGTLLAIGGILTVRPAHFTGFEPVQLQPNIAIVNLQERKIVKTLRGDATGPMAWSPDGNRLAVAGRGYVEIFDVRSSQALQHARVENSGHMNVRFSPEGRYFIESDWNGQGTGLGVKIWDGARHNLLQEILGDFASMAVSKDGKYLAVGSSGSTVIWRLK
jgi:WD40 repeat protein